MDNGQLFAGWRVERLGDVCEVISGQSPQGKFYNDTGTGTPFYQGKKEFGDKFIGRPKKWTSHITKMACLDDILMSVRAPVGPINFATQNLCIGRGLAAIRTGVKIDKDFLYYQLLSKQSEISGNEGAVFASINKKQIESIELSLPPLPEQKSIVAILDKAFAGISLAVANAEKNLTNARELFESYLNERLLKIASQPSMQTLSDICELIVDCEHKTAPKQETGYPSIRTPNIGKGYLILDNVNRVSEETYGLWTKRAKPLPGDLILAREAPAGNIGVIPDGEKVCLGQRTVLIRPNSNIVSPHYFAYLILHPLVRQKLLSHSTGATVQHVNMKDIRQLSIGYLPTLKEQLLDVQAIDKAKVYVNELETIYQQKLTALNELKQSILQKAFTGEVTQREENV